jgi:hypothetical protein
MALLPITFGINAKMKYDKAKKMYYSTKLTQTMSAERYHCLAEYVNLLMENAVQPDLNVDMKLMFNYIKEELIFDGSPEAMLLYDDLNEIWK